jgi:hypothetical protein
MPKSFATFSDFYPVYLAMHDNAVNRRLHVLGNVLALAAVVLALVTRAWWALAAAPVLGNGPAWVGHYVFQRNRPGVFTYPLYGLIGSWVMTWHVLTGKIPV